MSLKRFTKLMALGLTGAILFTGCGKINTSATLVTITNGDKTETISLGYGNFVARYNQALYDMYYGSYMGADMWTEDLSGSGSTMEDDTKKSVLEEMETWYVSTQHAGDYDVSVSSEDETAISEAVKAFMAANSGAAIEQLGATEEYVTKLLTDRTYAMRVQEAIEKDAEGEVEVTDKEAKQSTFSYLFFDKGEDDNPASVTADAVTDAIEDIENGESKKEDDEAAQAKTKADVAADAANFDEAAALSDVEPETYSYTTAADPAEDGGMDEAVIKAAKKLSEGEMSSVIETDDGYYVIRLDKKYDKEATESKRESLKSEKINDYYQDIIDGWKEEITWTVDEKAWAKVEFNERFSNGAPASSEGTDVTDKVLEGDEVDLSE